jgi:hypothetical protein
MRLFPLTLTSLVALLSHNSVVKANFDLYSGFLNYYDGNQQAYYRMWQIFDSDPPATMFSIPVTFIIPTT